MVKIIPQFSNAGFCYFGTTMLPRYPSVRLVLAGVSKPVGKGMDKGTRQFKIHALRIQFPIPIAHCPSYKNCNN
ncbi:MAG: hypothetical protein KME30_19390 [Iphinoe sp. HA4291-MV1]|nr:hypothetical protein [Iphinoe sp. HA4291-MV1]